MRSIYGMHICVPYTGVTYMRRYFTGAFSYFCIYNFFYLWYNLLLYFFRLCDPINTSNDNDIASFYELLAVNFAIIVQFNMDTRFTKSNLANINIDNACNIMVNKSIGSPVMRLARVNSLILGDSKTRCLDYAYSKMIMNYRNVSLSANVAVGGKFP